MAMSENVNLAWRMFKDLGYSDISASALIGNMMEESYPDVRPTAFNKNENAFGILQWRDTSGTNDAGVSWNSPRIQWLKAFAEQNGLDPEDIQTQVLFTDWELKNKFKGAYNKLWRSNDLAEATTIVDRDYVYSLGTSRDNRIKNANQVLKNFAGIKGDMNYYGSDTDTSEIDKIVNQKNESTGTGDDRSQFQNIINTSYINQANGEDMETENLGLSENNNNNKKETFVGRFKNYLTDPDNFGDFMGRLGTLANRLTLDPDPRYAERMNEQRLLQQQMEKQNATADVLENMGYPELAQMMRNGEITGANALSFIKGDKASSNKIKEFLEAKKLGLIGEDVSWEDYLLVKSGVVPEDEVTKALIKSDVARYEKFMEEAGNTTKQLDMLNELATLNVGKGDIQGGFAELKSGFYNVMAGFGLLSPEKQTMLANAQTFESFANQLVLDLMGGSLGAGFSDADRKFVISMAPMLGNTQKANEMVMEKMRAIILRREEVAQLMRAYFRDNNSLQGFQAFVNEKYGYTKTGKHQDGSNSLFGGKDKYIIKASINS